MSYLISGPRAYWKTHDNLLAVKTTSNYAEKTVIIKINIELNDISQYVKYQKLDVIICR